MRVGAGGSLRSRAPRRAAGWMLPSGGTGSQRQRLRARGFVRAAAGRANGEQNKAPSPSGAEQSPQPLRGEVAAGSCWWKGVAAVRLHVTRRD